MIANIKNEPNEIIAFSSVEYSELLFIYVYFLILVSKFYRHITPQITGCQKQSER
jgi:hypothetical protein